MALRAVSVCCYVLRPVVDEIKNAEVLAVQCRPCLVLCFDFCDTVYWYYLVSYILDMTKLLALLENVGFYF